MIFMWNACSSVPSGKEVANGSQPRVQQIEARRKVVDILPPVDLARESGGARVERRALDGVHVSKHPHDVFSSSTSTSIGVVATSGSRSNRVQVRLVREIEQVVHE